MIKHEALLLLALGLLVFIIVGCGGPSTDEIELAVRQSLQQHVPGRLAKYLTGGEQAEIEGVWVRQIGKPQGKGDTQYWPVKVYASGTCVIMFGGRQTFEGEMEYQLRQDPYGKWVAEAHSF